MSNTDARNAQESTIETMVRLLEEISSTAISQKEFFYDLKSGGVALQSEDEKMEAAGEWRHVGDLADELRVLVEGLRPEPVEPQERKAARRRSPTPPPPIIETKAPRSGPRKVVLVPRRPSRWHSGYPSR